LNSTLPTLIRQQRAISNSSPTLQTLFLTDGGVYDNLGLETAWKNYETILVSDGGGLPDDEPSQNETGLNTLIGF